MSSSIHDSTVDRLHLLIEKLNLREKTKANERIILNMIGFPVENPDF